jgi:hypothetical protein
MTKTLAAFVGLSVAACAGKPAARRVSLGPLQEAEKSAAPAKPGTQQLGVHRKVNPKLLAKGKWEKLSGNYVWRLELQSPGAKALRIHVTDMELREGSLVVRAPGGTPQVYRGKGPNGNGEFWTALVEGDRVSLELSGAAKTVTLPFRIPEVSHLWALPY